MFTGRVLEPGEPEFLPQDTDGAIALAEEERDTCPSCGLLKVWCRDPANQFGTFEAHEEQCHVTWTLATHRAAVSDKRDDATRAAVQVAARFKDGKQPDLTAGLDLGSKPDDDGDED